MAASATPPSADDAPTVAVAVSGGRDSTALLHATVRVARDLGLRVLALHVHHGLLPEADDWVAHLQRQCAAWADEGLPLRLRWTRLAGAPARGDSVEAWARRGRYAALARMAQEEGAGLVLLAHHRRDQAETFVLQALRGGGAAGLSGMPRVAHRHGVAWVRPWLEQPPEAVAAYAQAHGLAFVHDPSNDDTGFARNRLRHGVMPALREAFPAAESALAAAARHAQQARDCLDALAGIDRAACEDAAAGALKLDAISALAPARQANLLRHWLRERTGQGPAQSLLDRLLCELDGQGPATWVAGAWRLRRYRGLLRCEAAGPPAGATTPMPELLCITGPGRIELPAWSGALQVEAVAAHGLAAQRLAQGVELRLRRGGEQFALTPGGTPRSLKKQYQALGVAPWARGGPLLWQRDTLLFVPGLGVDARAWAAPGQPQLALTWCPAAAG